MLSLLELNLHGLCFVQSPHLSFSQLQRRTPAGQQPKAGWARCCPPSPSCTCLLSNREGGWRRLLSLGPSQTTQKGWAGKLLAQEPGRVGKEEVALYRTRGDSLRYPQSLFLIPASFWVEWQSPPQRGLPNLISPALSKWVIVQLLARFPDSSFSMKGQRGVKDAGYDQGCPTCTISLSTQNQRFCPPPLLFSSKTF